MNNVFSRLVEKSRSILTLAPNDELDCDEHFRVYRDYLCAAFSDANNKNIALSGCLGAGKSSILRSFDKYCNRGRSKFLYISLIDFENNQSNAEETNKTDQSSEDDSATKKEQKRLEDSLLSQIIARCRKKDLKEGSVLGVPERPRRMGMALISALMVLFICVLMFYESFENVVKIYIVKEEQLALIHAGTYAVVSVFSAFVAFGVILRGWVKKVTLKADKTEAEIAIERVQTPLDVYKIELIYALSQIADNIGYTVVFEDMDRVQPDVCVEIMTKLRELNILINVRRDKTRHWLRKCMDYLRGRGEPIRFVYALNDEVLNEELRTKFFDCIIPVVPKLNRFNANAVMMDLLEDCGVKIEDSEISQIIATASPFLSSYRTALSVRNEFVVLRDILEVNKQMSSSHNSWNHARLLTLSVYRVIYPNRYGKLFREADEEKVAEDILFDMFADYLSDDEMLRSVGATDLQILDVRLNILVNGSQQKRKEAWAMIIRQSAGDFLAHELILRDVFSYQEDFDLSFQIAEFIFFRGFLDEVSLKWFFELTEDRKWQKFTNCIHYLAATGEEWKRHLLRKKTPEELMAWFDCAKSDFALLRYDQKELNANWSPRMCNVLLDCVWEYRNEIGRKVRERTILGGRTLDELIKEREAKVIVN